MKAAILYNTNQPLKIEEGLQLPDLKPGHVHVKLEYAGLCHSQVMEARGLRGEDAWLPHLMGHEGVGEVLRIGSGVKKIKVGDRVVLGWIKGEGIDEGGVQYKLGDQLINAGAVTTFNTEAVVSENRLVTIPDEIPAREGVLLGCALPTGAGIIFNRIQPEDGATVGIIGLGGIGMSALIATGLYNLKTLVAVDLEEHKLDSARKFGASHTINSGTENVKERIMEITDGRGLDYTVEASGLTDLIEVAFESVRNGGGLCVFASHPKFGDRISLDPFDLICGKQIEGSWGGSSQPDRDIPKLVELYNQGKLPLEHFLSHSYTLAEINQAMSDLEDRKIVRALIEVNS